VFALEEVCVLILGNVSATPSSPVETLPACSREARLCSAKGESDRQDCSVIRHATQMLSHSASPIPGQNVRQPMLHEHLRKLLLSPDEFMRLLEDP
jgi:hypothetical protein